MHHIAIMNPKRKLIPRILAGEKTIESRWYLSRRAPWGKIVRGDTIFFKDSGKPVTIKATVSRVLEYEIESKDQLQELVRLYYKDIDKISYKDFFELVEDKQFCILMFLDEVETVKPFEIDKRGYGSMNAWITIPNIQKIKI